MLRMLKQVSNFSLVTINWSCQYGFVQMHLTGSVDHTLLQLIVKHHSWLHHASLSQTLEVKQTFKEKAPCPLWATKN